MPKRLIIFLAIVALCVVGVGAYFYHVKTRGGSTTTRRTPFASSSASRIYFRYTGVDQNYGKLAFVSLTNPNAPQFVDKLSCEVVYFANGSGICLQADRGVFTTYAATLFDSKFATRATFPLHGGPSRARISPDGKIAGFTVFLSGHGYASLDFSTETLLVDTLTGKVIAALESNIKVTRDGKPFAAKDFNFWGVTFTPDSKHFYCTLSTAGTHYLIKGDIAARTAVVVHDNVECPSVSPDGTRVAYKKRFVINNRLIWQLHVLDLATKHETPLAEKRSLDDQLEWLDNDHVLYTVSDNPEGSSGTTNVWKANADGTGTPMLFHSESLFSLGSAMNGSVSESELIDACRRGQRDAWDALFDKYYGIVARFVFQLSAEFSHEDTEEICQETFLSVVRSLGSFHAKSSFQTWLLRIAANKAMDYRQKTRAAKRGGGAIHVSLDGARDSDEMPIDPPSTRPGPDALLSNAETLQLVRQSLDRLGDNCREIIELRYYGDLSYDEIAAELRLNPKTVSSRLSKCLDQLGAIAKQIFPSEHQFAV